MPWSASLPLSFDFANAVLSPMVGANWPVTIITANAANIPTVNVFLFKLLLGIIL